MPAPGSTTGLSYDADGNETANPGSATQPGSAYSAVPARAESYNDRDQQTGITPAGADPLANYFYGEDNTVNNGIYDATTDTLIGDETTMLGITTDAEPDSSLTEYIRTPDGQLVAEETDHGTGYYLTDNLGSIVGLVNSSGTVLAQYAYDPAGDTRDITGNLAEQALNPWGYAHGYTEITGYTTGLIKYGARYYDPNTSRFTQQDPSGQETNPYAYAGSNPVNNVDPTGYFSLSSFVGSLLFSAGGAATCIPVGILATPLAGAACGATFAGLEALGSAEGE